MKKIGLLAVMVMVLALVFSASGIAVAGEVYAAKIQGDPVSPRFERINLVLTAHNSPPQGYRTVRTVVEIVAGFNVCYWGKEGMRFEKKTAIQKWIHPNGVEEVYNLFLPNKEMAALVCIKNRERLAIELTSWKARLDREEAGPASVGSQVWINLDLKNFLDRL
ncbi:MAG: hypothetical protein U9Q72_02930 [Patescibacteria group bacterium]|nr:hypothetical protein [Patescibacteria group bacterium]